MDSLSFGTRSLTPLGKPVKYKMLSLLATIYASIFSDSNEFFKA
jgi:hypothetical protein